MGEPLLLEGLGPPHRGQTPSSSGASRLCGWAPRAPRGRRTSRDPWENRVIARQAGPAPRSGPSAIRLAILGCLRPSAGGRGRGQLRALPKSLWALAAGASGPRAPGPLGSSVQTSQRERPSCGHAGFFSDLQAHPRVSQDPRRIHVRAAPRGFPVSLVSRTRRCFGSASGPQGPSRSSVACVFIASLGFPGALRVADTPVFRICSRTLGSS